MHVYNNLYNIVVPLTIVFVVVIVVNITTEYVTMNTFCLLSKMSYIYFCINILLQGITSLYEYMYVVVCCCSSVVKCSSGRYQPINESFTSEELAHKRRHYAWMHHICTFAYESCA